MRSGDYELLPQEEIKRLRHEVEDMRGKQNLPDSEELQDSIRKLSHHLEDILTIFERAADDLHEEDKEAEIIAKKINPIFERISLLEEQNSKIAKAMVALHSMIDEKVRDLDESSKEISDNAVTLSQNMQHIMSKLDEVGHNIVVMNDKLNDSHSSSSPSLGNMPPPPPPMSGDKSGKGQQGRDKGFHMFKH